MSAVGSILSNDGALKALNSIRQSSNTTTSLQTQLSSGQKVNSPADNPSGYITAQGFTSQLNGITQALSNANQGVSLLQTAQGAINQQTSILQKINSIAVQASNGTQTSAESKALQSVVSQLNSQVDTISKQTQFNNINLLDGSFSGVDFQVGANKGQTLSLSIGGTAANNIGQYASTATAAGEPATLTSGSSAGAYTAGTIDVNGSNGTAQVTVGSATQSAASIAQSVNAQTDETNVQAQATTEVTFTASSNNYQFTLGNGSAGSASNAVNISATGTDGLIEAVNSNTATTGISATTNATGDVVLTQAEGKNISFTNVTQGSLTGTAGSITGSSSGASATIQGRVEFQSDTAFNLGSGSLVGLNDNSSLKALSDIDVSTTEGAQDAINVVKFALQKLGAEGGELGAVQQRLQANINNLNTSSQNLTSARSVVQDANIPEVSQQLTQQQVLQQTGIAALSKSSQLQQQYAQLLR